MDPGIICFQHCGPRIFCFSLPVICPICDVDLDVANFSTLPFRVPYPFVQASQYPCAVVIKPTVGDFLNEYFNSTDLHIGLTTSNGTIVEFDKNGLRIHNNHKQWGQSLLIEQIPNSWREQWDQSLALVCKEEKSWSPSHYREDSNNCYSFVLQFLVTLKYGQLSEAAQSKTIFCEKFVVPRTTAAGKYISLYRRLKSSRFYIYRCKNKK